MLIIYLKLPLTDINLTEESVHDVARQQKDVNMAVLITTHLRKKIGLKTQPVLSVNLNYFSDPLLWSEGPCRQIGTNKSFIVGHNNVIGLY